MKAVDRASKYIGAKDLADRWGLLCKWEKRYVKHLVKTYGYPVSIAIQHAFIFGWDKFPYDYRSGKPVVETTPKKRFYRD